MVAFVGVEYLGLFSDPPGLNEAEAVLGGIVTITAIALSPAMMRVLPMVALGVGVLVVVATGTPAVVLLDSLRELSNIAPLLTFVPLLGIVFSSRPYGQALFGTGTAGRRSPVAFQMGVSLVTHLTAAVGALSAVPITFEVMKQAVAGSYLRLRRGGVAILRGYVTSMLWAPNATAFAVAVHYTGAPLPNAILVGLSVAVTLMLLQVAWEWWEERRWSHKSMPDGGDTVVDQGHDGRDGLGSTTSLDRPRLVAEFILIMVALLGSVILLEQWTGLTILHLIPLVSIGLLVVYMLIRAGPQQLGHVLSDYYRHGLPERYRELAIMQCGGFLAGCLRQSGLGDAGVQLLLGIVSDTSYALAPALSLCIVLMAMAGFPPIPATLIVAASIHPATYASAPAYFSIALLLGTGTAFLIAPLSIPVIILAGMMRTGTVILGLRSNWLFAPLLFVVGQVVLWVLRAYTPLY